MAVSAKLRLRIKQVLRPAVLPLVRRLRLPFVILLPRIEALEQRVAGSPPDATLQDKVGALARSVESLAGTADNLTRTWLRLQNEVTRIAGQVSAAALAATQARLGDLAARLHALESGAEAARAQAVADSGQRAALENLTRTWLKQQNELARLAASLPELVTQAVAGQNERIEQRQQTALRQFAEASEARLQALEAAAGGVSGQMQQIDMRQQATERAMREDIAGRGERVDNTLRFLLDRVEFVRREMLLELRYGPEAAAAPNSGAPHSGAPHAGAAHARVARIVAPDKIAAARAAGRLRLNLGSGHIIAPDYVNVDFRDLPGIDVVAEVSALPFDPQSVDEIASAHLVEHFPQEELTRRLLPHWRDLLKPGGLLRMVTPDGQAMVAGLADGSYSFEDFREVLFGGQDYEGDFHYNFLTPDSLRRLVEAAGFTDVEVPVRGRRNGQCFEFELLARLPGEAAQA